MMTDDEIEYVREYLRNRVRQTEKWASSGFPSDAFLEFRELIEGDLYDIRPREYLKRSKERKQDSGVRFSVTSTDDTKRIVFVDVLLAPEWKKNEIQMNGPVVKVKAVELKDGRKVHSRHDIISPPLKLEDCDPEATIDEFYKTWLRRAFKNKRKSKIVKAI